MRITTKGQVTIPKTIRDSMGLRPLTEIEFVVVSGNVQLRKKRGAAGRGKNLIGRMKGKATAGMTTEEIMALTRTNQ